MKDRINTLMKLAKDFFTYEVATDTGHLLRLVQGDCVESNNRLFVKIGEHMFSNLDGNVCLSAIDLPARVIRGE